jgi:hypothetical protein
LSNGSPAFKRRRISASCLTMQFEEICRRICTGFGIGCLPIHLVRRDVERLALADSFQHRLSVLEPVL